MRAAQSFLVILLLTSAALLRGGSEILRSDGQIEVGALTVGSYEVNKVFSRYIEINKKPRNEATVAEWFAQYRHELIVLATAAEAGYLQRPSIVESVYRMERNMLTSTVKPLREFLQRSLTAWREIPRADVLVVSRSTPRNSSSNTVPLRPEQQRAAGTFTVHERGMVLSETECSQEVRHRLEVAEPGESILELVNGVVVAEWRKDLHLGTPSGAEVAAAFPTDTAFSLPGFPEAWTIFIDRLMEDWTWNEDFLRAKTPALLGELATPAELQSEGEDDALATYRNGARQVRIDSAKVLEFYRRLYFKSPVTDVVGLKALIKAVAHEELTYAIALSFGMHRGTQFKADKRAYTHALALEEYMRAVIDPTIDPRSGDAEAWYRKHIHQFTKPSWVQIDVQIFDSEAAADEVAKRLQASDRNTRSAEFANPIGTVPNRTATRLTRTDTRVDPPTSRLLWRMPIGRPLPPTRFDGKPAIIVKRAEGGAEAEPFAAVEAQIRRRLVQEARPAALAQHAARGEAHHPLRMDRSLFIEGVGALAPVVERHVSRNGANP